ncbi:hypothetical protein [Idiomarina xiamenensis]|uniref:Lipoprotein n=1 Tax=Idiomarina xiamenensis 10-D-4 TaxID=740709 RepID=K2KN44_9GAMM|nr:hypothetical protein [Idiomarina xiamenensis]EKE83884.1 hypothetical protein A10D4_07051 [Idiomarina xiamenensis 10-D-4]
MMKKISLAAASLLVVSSLLLSACDGNQMPVSQGPVATLDARLLPNDEWQLSSQHIQLSFCRDRINEALLAEADELRRWRVVEQVTAFPPYRHEGLAELARFEQQYGLLLWQLSGNVSSQRYALVTAAAQPQASASDVFAALTTLSRDDAICYSAVE